LQYLFLKQRSLNLAERSINLAAPRRSVKPEFFDFLRGPPLRPYDEGLDGR
jgi:hypothetical protein